MHLAIDSTRLNQWHDIVRVSKKGIDSHDRSGAIRIDLVILDTGVVMCHDGRRVAELNGLGHDFQGLARLDVLPTVEIPNRCPQAVRIRQFFKSRTNRNPRTGGQQSLPERCDAYPNRADDPHTGNCNSLTHHHPYWFNSKSKRGCRIWPLARWVLRSSGQGRRMNSRSMIWSKNKTSVY